MSNNPLFVGVDVHRKTNTICLMNRDGQEIGQRFSVPNNRQGTATFARAIDTLATEEGYDAVQIAAEATGWYWWHFFQMLDQDTFLNQRPLTLYPFNPRLTANFRKIYSDLDKTDTIDAFVVADRLRLGHDLPYPFSYDADYMAARLLTRHRFHLIHNLVREKSYFLAHLYLKASEYTHLMPFSDTFGATSRAIVQDYPSIEAIAALPLEQLVEIIDVKGKRRFANPEDNARRPAQRGRGER